MDFLSVFSSGIFLKDNQSQKRGLSIIREFYMSIFKDLHNNGGFLRIPWLQKGIFKDFFKGYSERKQHLFSEIFSEG